MDAVQELIESDPGYTERITGYPPGSSDAQSLLMMRPESIPEDAKLVPAYLIVVPLELAEDAPMQKEVAVAMPILEAVEHAALRAGVPVDARVESGRTAIHALKRLWDVERFDRIVVPAPVGRSPGFSPKDLTWMLTHAPSETLILRPDPAAERRLRTA